MVSDKKRANAVEGKMPRACDVCTRKRARLYCASDDAFLCQACDASVHSANPLACRHERVRLKMASSFKRSEEDENQENCGPTWHHGLTKKARTPRHGKHYNSNRKSSEDQLMLDLPHPVPEICSDEASQEDNENQLLYWVPVFDPFVAAPCTVLNPNEERMVIFEGEAKRSDIVARNESKNALWHDVNYLHGFLPSEMDLADFAADVQTMLGKGLEVESFDMERLGLLDCKEEKLQEGCFGSGRMKVEEEAAAASIADQVNTEIDVSKEPFELNLDDYDSSITREGDEKIEQMDMIAKKDEELKEYVIKRKKNSLRLNYEGVLTAWDDQRSPWTIGERPEVDLNENDWPYFMSTCGSGTVHQPYVEMGIIGGGQTIMMEWGREARVLRYREKRRTRLFSKKIRYEVRKLNAEKRPRMQGRFVKRSNFAAPAAFPLLNK